MSTSTTCRTCGTALLANARFCHSCGSPVAVVAAPAEYKQVTVLFADLEVAEQSGDEFALAAARLARGIALAHGNGAERDQGLELLALAREAALNQRFIASLAQVADTQIALQMAQAGDPDGAIRLLRAVVRTLFESGVVIWYVPAAIGLVRMLLDRNASGDRQEAEAVLDGFAEAVDVSELGLHEAWLLYGRALLAQAQGDGAADGEYVERYLAKAKRCGFAGHIAMAEEMR